MASLASGAGKASKRPKNQPRPPLTLGRLRPPPHTIRITLITDFVLRPETLSDEQRKSVERAYKTDKDVRRKIDSLKEEESILKNALTSFSDV